MSEEYDIELMPGFVLVEPFRPDAGIVRAEKKYDRHSLATVLLIGALPKFLDMPKPSYVSGKTIIAYNDSNSIETQIVWDGKKRNVEIIKMTDIVAYLRKGKNE